MVDDLVAEELEDLRIGDRVLLAFREGPTNDKGWRHHYLEGISAH